MSVQYTIDSSQAVAALQKLEASHEKLTRTLGKEYLKNQELTSSYAQAIKTISAVQGAYASLEATNSRLAAEQATLAATNTRLAASNTSLTSSLRTQQAEITALTRQVSTLTAAKSKAATADASMLSGVTKITSANRDLHSALRGTAGALGGLWLAYGNILPMMSAFLAVSATKNVYDLGSSFEYLTTFSHSLSDMTVSLGGVQEKLLSMKGLGQTPTELAGGFHELVKAGLSTKEAFEDLDTVAKYATVSEQNMGTATEQLVTIQSAFKNSSKGLSGELLTLSDVADIVATAANKSVVSFGDMQNAYRMVLSLAPNLKANIYEVSAALMVLGDRGLKSTLGATSLRTGLMKLLNPTKAAMKALDEAGATMKKFADHDTIVSISEMFKELERLRGVMGADEWQKFAISAFGMRGINITAIIDSYKDFEQSLEEVKTSAGGVEAVFSRLSQTTQKQMKDLKASFEEAFIKAFDGEKAREVIGDIKNIVESKEFAGGLEGLVSGFGSITSAMAKLAENFYSLPTEWQTGGIIMGLFLGPYGKAALAVMTMVPDTINDITDSLKGLSIALASSEISLADWATSGADTHRKWIDRMNDGTQYIRDQIHDLNELIAKEKEQRDSASATADALRDQGAMYGTMVEKLDAQVAASDSLISSYTREKEVLEQLLGSQQSKSQAISAEIDASIALSTVESSLATTTNSTASANIAAKATFEERAASQLDWIKKLNETALVDPSVLRVDAYKDAWQEGGWNDVFLDGLEDANDRAIKYQEDATTKRYELEKKLNDDIAKLTLSETAYKKYQLDQQIRDYESYAEDDAEIADKIAKYRDLKNQEIVASDSKMWKDIISNTNISTATIAEAWAKGEQAKVVITKLAYNTLTSLGDSYLKKSLEWLIEGKGTEIGAYLGLGTAQTSADDKTTSDWKTRLINAAAFAGLAVAAVVGAKALGEELYATGGWVGEHGSGLIRQGSGVADDVFLGYTFSDGGVARNWGMGGEWVLDKKTTQANLGFLHQWNGSGKPIGEFLSTYKYASGGNYGTSPDVPIKDPLPVTQDLNDNGFGVFAQTFVSSYVESGNWQESLAAAIAMALVYYGGAAAAMISAKEAGPDLMKAEGGMIYDRKFGLGGWFKEKFKDWTDWFIDPIQTWTDEIGEDLGFSDDWNEFWGAYWKDPNSSLDPIVWAAKYWLWEKEHGGSFDGTDLFSGFWEWFREQPFGLGASARVIDNALLPFVSEIITPNGDPDWATTQNSIKAALFSIGEEIEIDFEDFHTGGLLGQMGAGGTVPHTGTYLLNQGERVLTEEDNKAQVDLLKGLLSATVIMSERVRKLEGAFVKWDKVGMPPERASL